MKPLDIALSIIRFIRPQPAAPAGRAAGVDEKWSRIQTSLFGYQRIQSGCACYTCAQIAGGVILVGLGVVVLGVVLGMVV